jgi:integrase
VSAAIIFASHLGPFITRYLALKQALGRKYATERIVLAHLDTFLETHGTEIAAESFAVWCSTIAHLSAGVRRNWMRVARNLCLYRKRSEPACFVPDPSAFPRPHEPRRPYLFTERDIVQLLRTTDGLRPTSTSPLRREVFRLAIVLLYTAGLRRGEVVRLTLGDYDPAEQTLMIRASKFHKSRLVPLSSDAVREIDAYLVARRRLPHSVETPLLCNSHGGLHRYTGAGLAQGLRQLLRRAGVRTATGALPRVHDVRHSFAHRALLRWYRAGIDVQAKLPALATYMGHVSVVSTQHYLSFLEPFAEAASERFAQHCDPFVSTASGGDQ